jgi:ElaB/YqjD/DUF883 family membrane-anchored ribosome-binding protein
MLHRSLESQLDKVNWRLNESNNQLRTLKDDHEKLLQYSSQQSGTVAASQRRSAAAIRKLNEDLQQVSEGYRNESAAAAEAATQERERLLQQLETLTRYSSR